MSIAIIDTTVVLHLFRKYEPAVAWFNTDEVFSITAVSWMEVMVGVTNKRTQAETLELLNSFEMLYLTTADQVWAMQQIERLRFSHSIGMNDCLIASVAFRLQIPLFTHNLKDMKPLIGDLAIKPYG